MGLLQGSPPHSGRRGGPAAERKQVLARQEIRASPVRFDACCLACRLSPFLIMRQRHKSGELLAGKVTVRHPASLPEAEPSLHGNWLLDRRALEKSGYLQQ